MSAPLVAVEGLHRSFERDPLRRLFRRRRRPALHVLRGVDLTLEPGEWLGLLGGNGVGKTTLLKIAAGLLLPSAGSVRIDGKDAQHDAGAVRDAVGYVLADERSFHWRLSARQNLRFFASLDRLSGGEASGRIEELLARLDLAGDADRPVYELSTGMRQRLALARSLLKRPRVLLMDEPTRSIDATHAAEVWPLVRAELEAVDGCAILVTHYRREAEAQCSRLAWLEDGVLRERPSAERAELAGGELLTVTVRRLAPGVVETLRRLPGVDELDLSAGRSGDQVIELATAGGGGFSLATFIEVLTSEGASVVTLEVREAPPGQQLQAVGQGAAR